MNLKTFLTFLLTISYSVTYGAIFKGKVLDDSKNPIPYAEIIISKDEKKFTADEYGNFNISLIPGKYSITFEALGYYSQEISIRLSANEVLEKNITLSANEKELAAIEIRANSRDIAKEVMSKASKRKDDYLNKYESFQMETYYRMSLREERDDTISYHKDSIPDPLPRIHIQSHLSEVKSTVSRKNSKFKELIYASNEFTKEKPYNGGGVSMSMEIGEQSIAPQQWLYSDNYLLQSYSAFTEFDFNLNLLDLPNLSDRKFLSPLAPTAVLNYKFDLISIFYVDTIKYYKIQFQPIFKTEALFHGNITIQDSTWAVKNIEASVYKYALKFHENITISQQYKEFNNGIYFPIQRQINYTIKEGKRIITGSLVCFNQQIDFEPTFDPKLFSEETKTYTDDAFDKDAAYWNLKRATPFDTLEQRYARECDSLQTLYKSPEFYHEIDSAYNSLRFMDFILYGVGYKNRYRNYEFYINPLIAQVNPVGIGGYRHRLGGNFTKEFDNAYTLETTGEIDYGFRNKDIRGRAGIGLTYVPKKFVRTFIRFGDFYDMINTYASIGSIFSRSNFVRTQSFSVAQKMEVVNGLFAELTLEFSDQKPITELTLERWSERVFGSLNAPIDFDRYIKSEIRLDILYRFKQKFMIKKKKKIILGSAYPEVNFVWRKGIPGLFQSEVNFDYLELGIRHDKELGRWGTAQWSFLAGSFVNKKNLRILEHRYFRGSDAFFFSDPLRSFQLLGPTLSTPNAFLRGNYFHHLDGVFLNKIPLINRLKLTEAIGAAFLSIPDQNFFHAEMYLGLERVVRIRRELFRFGVYGATADGSISNARFEFKIGVNFYNTFTKKWSY
jgi:hypothetical protein